MDSSSTISIIVGALMAVTAAGIALSLTNTFGSSVSDHSDRAEVGSVVSSIETGCERLEQQDDLAYSTQKEFELRRTGFDINTTADPPYFKFDPDGEDEEIIEIECSPGVSFDYDPGDEYDIPTGDSEASINQDGNQIKVELR